MYTPGADTAKFLNRQVKCPCCDGKGYYVAGYSSDGFNLDGERRYQCENCHQGKVNWRDYKKHFESVFGPAKFF